MDFTPYPTEPGRVLLAGVMPPLIVLTYVLCSIVDSLGFGSELAVRAKNIGQVDEALDSTSPHVGIKRYLKNRVVLRKNYVGISL